MVETLKLRSGSDITAQLREAIGQGNKTVQLEAGHFFISQQIGLRAGLTLRGAPEPGATTIEARGDITLFRGKHCDGFTAEDLTLIGPGAANSSISEQAPKPKLNGLRVAKSDEVVLSRLSVSDTGRGLSIEAGCIGAVVENCSATNCSDFGIGGYNRYPNASPIQVLTILRCSVRNCSGTGIRTEGVHGGLLTQNDVFNCRTGFRIEDSVNVEVSHNRTERNECSGIHIYNRSTGCTVHHNQSHDNNRRGITEAPTEPNASNENAAIAGITVAYACHHNVIAENVCSNTASVTPGQLFGIGINLTNHEAEGQKPSFNKVLYNDFRGNHTCSIEDRGSNNIFIGNKGGPSRSNPHIRS